MPTRPELVRVQLDNGQEASVGASFAKSHGLTVLDKPARDARGRVLPAAAPPAAAEVELKGKALDAALEEAGLDKTGTADAKRQRLVEHQASVDLGSSEGSNDGAAGAPNE